METCGVMGWPESLASTHIPNVASSPTVTIKRHIITVDWNGSRWSMKACTALQLAQDLLEAAEEADRRSH